VSGWAVVRVGGADHGAGAARSRLALYFTVLWEGQSWALYGRFVEIKRPGKVEYTWMSEGTKGVESTVRVTFEGRGEETEVTLRHLTLPDDELGRQTEWGWAHILASVAEVLAKQSASA
jgi:uncharacterized protein YndB with AHSA1/START domain